MDNKKRVAFYVIFGSIAYGLNIVGMTPILGMLPDVYPNLGTSAIQMIQTIPCLMMMVAALSIGYLVTKVPKKKILLTGMAITAICGVAPAFSSSLVLLIIARLGVGLGLGLFGPLCSSVITDNVEAEKRAPFMGMMVVGIGIGAMIGNIIGGILGDIGYNYFYFTYLMAVLGFVVVLFVLEEKPPVKVNSVRELKLTPYVFVLAAESFAHTLFIYIYNTNISMYVLSMESGTNTMTGIVTALNSILAMITGISFGFVARKLGKFTFSASMLAAVIGFASLVFVPGIPGVIIASAMCGISLSSFMATSAMLISIAVQPDAVARANGVFTVLGNIGGLLAPIIIGAISGLLPGGNTPENQFVIGLAGMAILFVASIFLNYKHKD